MSKMIEVRADSQEALEQIDDVLHDRWFDVDDVRFDEAGRFVQVPFRGQPKGTRRASDAKALMLEIRHVEQNVLKDTERIRFYDFNRLVFSRDSSTLRIETGIPLGLEMRVARLDVRVFEP